MRNIAIYSAPLITLFVMIFLLEKINTDSADSSSLLSSVIRIKSTIKAGCSTLGDCIDGQGCVPDMYGGEGHCL